MQKLWEVKSLIKWTDEQLMAIEERNCDLLVAAAAGAGKTAVLVERIIQRIIYDKNPIDIDNMLIVTFTNAAAAEMRERIALALDKAIEKNPDSHRLQRQLLLLPKAGITTIHSFCMDVLKNNYHRLDIAPDFRIADATESLLLKIEAVDELFEEEYEKGDEGFYKLLDSYSGNRGDDKLKEMVMEIYDFIQSTPWPELWLKEMIKAYEVEEDFDFIKTPWARIILELLNIELEGCANSLKKAYKIAQKGYGLDKCAYQLSQDLENIKSLVYKEGRSWDELYVSFNNFEFDRQNQGSKDKDKEAYELLKNLRKEAKDKINKLKTEFFADSEKEIKEDIETLFPLVEYLCHLVIGLDKLYMDLKKEKDLIDFNDLEHFSLEILTEKDHAGKIMPSSVALSLRDKYEEIMIDEYQDSNLVQEVILSLVSKREMGNPNVFMVGDVKQSIYRFRQAKPELFLEKYQRYSEESGGKDRKVMLYKNFRSRKEIIYGVNWVFRQLMTDYIGEIDYCEKEFLNFGAFFESDESDKYHLEIHLLDLSEDEVEDREISQSDNDEILEENAEEEDLEKVQAEARIVAKRIMELVGQSGSDGALQIYDKDIKGYRRVAYKDIVVLLRTVKNWAETFEEELESMGIPVFADTGTGYFKRMEVQIILSLLQIIDNPLQDIALLTVLKSPIGGFSSQELLDIRSLDKFLSFYKVLQMAAENRDKVGEKAELFLNRLDLWREKALYMQTDELIWFLYSDTGYLNYVGAMPGGHQRQANLHILYERAKQYEDTSFKGLFNFINFIEKIKTGSGDMGSAKILGEMDNVVRIMSIHKSKGLEFPVVFISGIGKAFNMQDTRKAMLLHHEMGFGADLVDVEKRTIYATLPKIAIKHKIIMETLSEEMRILYVAMTRAKEKLIISGFDKDLLKTIEKWQEALDYTEEKLAPHMILKGNKLLNWLGISLIRHKDMGELRISGDNYDGALLDDNSPWKLYKWNKAQLLKEKQKEVKVSDFREILNTIEKDKEKGDFKELIDNRLNWVYPYEEATTMPVKLSVTELKRLKVEHIENSKVLFEPSYTKTPLFMEKEKSISAAQRGSIVHYIMQHLDIGQVGTVDTIKSQVEQMVANDYLTIEQAKIVNYKKILDFFKSHLGQRILNADKVYREIPFNIEISAGEVFDEYKDVDEKILLQGVMDCYFIENDNIILLDYKTDYIDGDEGEIAQKRYGIQIDYYSKALELILGKKVSEKYIYFFHTGKGVRVL